MENSGYIPRKTQLRQSRATQPTVHAAYLSVSIAFQTLTWTTESLTYPCGKTRVVRTSTEGQHGKLTLD